MPDAQTADDATPLNSSSVQLNAEPVPSSSGRWFGWLRRGDPVLKAEQEYASALSACASEDFSDLDDMDFLRASGATDRMGRPVVTIIARNFKAKIVPRERLYRYLITRLDPVVGAGGYSLAWVHTQASYWENCPGVGWLWGAYEALPPRYRANLRHVYVLHCDMSLWVGVSLVCPWFSSLAWRKVVWVSRVEFLWDHLNKKSLPLPAFVAEHDALLEEQPLQDYGLVADRNLMPMGVGMPAPS